jgi:hypothetical protein
MSSPKRAAAKSAPKAKAPPSARLVPPAKAKTTAAKAEALPSARLVPPAKSRPVTASAAATGATSNEATRLAAEIERALASGKLDTLTPQALHARMSACCKTYATRVEAGEDLLPIPQRSTVSPTEVMVTASGLLRAANLAVFELGMWQSWTGR